MQFAPTANVAGQLWAKLKPVPVTLMDAVDKGTLPALLTWTVCCVELAAATAPSEILEELRENDGLATPVPPNDTEVAA
jgi:hypothetical protein